MSLKLSYDSAQPNEAAIGRYDFLRTGLYQESPDVTPRAVAFLRAHSMDSEGNSQSPVIAANEVFLRELERQSISELSDKNNLNPNSAANLNMVYNALPVLSYGQRHPETLGAVITDATLDTVGNNAAQTLSTMPKPAVDPLALKF